MPSLKKTHHKAMSVRIKSKTKSPSRPKTKSPSRPKTKSPSRTKSKSPSRTKSKSPSRPKTKSPSKTKSKTLTRPKTKSPTKTRTKKTKTRGKSQRKQLDLYKYIEYPYYEKNELVDKDFKHKVIHGANMKDMNLSGAKLQGTKFVECIFNNTNFDGAHIDTHTEFIDCHFRNCKTENIKYMNGANKEDFDKVFQLNKVSYV